MNKESVKMQIAEINKQICDGIGNWADVMLIADADEWAFRLNYSQRDILNAVMIFQHVCSNVGIKNGFIANEKCAEVYGKRLRELVKDMTGYDPADIVTNLKK